MKVFHFEDPTHKIDFHASGGRAVFHLLKKPVRNQYLQVLRTLNTPKILVPLQMSAPFQRHYLCSTEYFSRSHTSKRF